MTMLDRFTVLGCLASIMGWGVILHGSEVEANMRAPHYSVEHSSSSISKTAAPLTVLSENLLFECRPSPRWTCTVTAQYRVQAEGTIQLELDFIVPEESDIHVEVADEKKKVKTVAYEPSDEEGYPPPYLRPFGPTGDHLPPLYRATFTADLIGGENLITLRYEQRLGSQEQGPYYFRDSTFFHLLRYEVWPLKEWSAAEDFVMEVELRLERSPPGLWARLRRTYPSVLCGPDMRRQSGEFDEKSHYEKIDDGVVYRVAFGFDELPDRLMCWFGEARTLGVRE